MPYLLGFGIPIGYLAMWTLTARTLYRRYHLIEGEKRNCPSRAKKPETHGNPTSMKICTDCSKINKQWWQEALVDATARGLSDANLAWDCMVQSFLWPITLTAWLMITSIMANPPRSPREVEAERARLQKRTEELEKQLDAALGDAR